MPGIQRKRGFESLQEVNKDPAASKGQQDNYLRNIQRNLRKEGVFRMDSKDCSAVLFRLLDFYNYVLAEDALTCGET